MNDRFLFRGIKSGTSEWIYGSHVYSSSNNEHYIIPFDKSEIDEYYGGERCWNTTSFYNKAKDVLIDPDTLCQCVGKKDKNSKLIFENDVLFAKDERGNIYTHVVKWNGLGFVIVSPQGNVDGLVWCSTNYEIIGTIFDKEEVK